MKKGSIFTIVPVSWAGLGFSTHFMAVWSWMVEETVVQGENLQTSIGARLVTWSPIFGNRESHPNVKMF